jgi:5-methylcytosine-specific restriction enzyme A
MGAKVNPHALPPAAWYGLREWRTRAARQLQLEPLCAMCRAAGRSVPAFAADHVEPHRGIYNAFRLGKLQSLCEGCHNRTKQQRERRGYSLEIDAAGLPVDSAHPFNTGKMPARR